MTSPWPVQHDVYEGTLDCVHCGLCLSSCPTYIETGRESASPRGRIYLMRGVAEGEIELGERVAEELHLCLGCRACETACPSGVRYGALLEQARSAVAEARLRRGLAPRIEALALGHIVHFPKRLRALMSLLAGVQLLRLDRLAAFFLPRSAKNAIALAPRVPSIHERRRLPAFTEAEGERRGRVALLEGCVMPEMFGAVNRATVQVLARNGFDVVVPAQQACCGALHAHAGDLSRAHDLARRNIVAFSSSECPPGSSSADRADGADEEAVDAIVVNSAGCGAAMRDVAGWLPGEGEAMAARVRDVCEFLDQVGLRAPTERVVGRLCYDDPCHLIHGQLVAEAPRRILRQIEGLELVPHADASECCGAAGTYNLTQPKMSAAILGRKLDALEAASPDIVATGNPGCILQLRKGVQERALQMRIAHPIELLAEAYGFVEQ